MKSWSLSEDGDSLFWCTLRSCCSSALRCGFLISIWAFWNWMALRFIRWAITRRPSAYLNFIGIFAFLSFILKRKCILINYYRLFIRYRKIMPKPVFIWKSDWSMPGKQTTTMKSSKFMIISESISITKATSKPLNIFMIALLRANTKNQTRSSALLASAS